MPRLLFAELGAIQAKRFASQPRRGVLMGVLHPRGLTMRKLSIALLASVCFAITAPASAQTVCGKGPFTYLRNLCTGGSAGNVSPGGAPHSNHNNSNSNHNGGSHHHG